MFSSNNFTRLFCLYSFFWSVSALASDGVLEINQACALNGGCFSGDDAGFPVTISSPGSYRLTSSLSVGNPDKLAIDITADRVSLDLNGFAVTICVGVFCGIGDGNHAIQAFVSNELRIHNGLVQGAIQTCIGAGNYSQLRNLIIKDCGIGIGAGSFARISDVTVIDSTSVGVNMGHNSVLARSTVSGSGGFGVWMDINSVLARSTVSESGGFAVSVISSALIVDSVLDNNSKGAIAASAVSNLKGGYRGNIITRNDPTNEDQNITSILLNLGGNICGTDTICP